MIRVGVVGATGYAGAELVRIIAGHPDASLTVLTSRQYAGEPFETIYPAMKGLIDLNCEVFDNNSICSKTDVIFLALPHKLPMAFVPDLLKNGKKIIDLSADFRFSDPATYEAVYQLHTSKDLLSQSVYGLSEVFTDQIKNADLVGNPGCYPTSVILPLYPLLKSDLIDVSTIIADSKSGASGAGRSLSLATHICEITESFKAYKVTGHRHKPEMDEILTAAAGKPVDITFIPHLLPMSRGMESTIYAGLKKSVTPDEIHNCLADFYSGCPFVRIYDHGIATDTANVRGTNFCDIGFVLEKDKDRIIMMSVIDNLVKGASGQAVQNMNLMLGMDETVGLKAMPYPI
ncbi:MAG: N-acetyl-gamma-glutamyl-phosphate reductase [Desulfobacteraceae bacterium]|nr:N-acetyl-gamma-glutamyl-phosphate reductase [Desulfobacteraceae bacterium]MBC2754502.1 N-acetyl-gamma-glutamyl-phosphate reductase [Desulfobacteraceae bacterium]